MAFIFQRPWKTYVYPSEQIRVCKDIYINACISKSIVIVGKNIIENKKIFIKTTQLSFSNFGKPNALYKNLNFWGKYISQYDWLKPRVDDKTSFMKHVSSNVLFQRVCRATWYTLIYKTFTFLIINL